MSYSISNKCFSNNNEILNDKLNMQISRNSLHKYINNSHLIEKKKKIYFKNNCLSKKNKFIQNEKEKGKLQNNNSNINEFKNIDTNNDDNHRNLNFIKKSKSIHYPSDLGLKYVKQNLTILKEKIDKRSLQTKIKIKKKKVNQILLPDINKINNKNDNIIETNSNISYDENFAIIMYPQKSTKIKTQLTTKIKSFDRKNNIVNKNNEVKNLSYKNVMKIPSNRIYIPHSISSSNVKYKKKSFNKYSNELLFQLKSRRFSDIKFLERIKSVVKKKKELSFESNFEKSFEEIRQINNEKIKKMRNKYYNNLINMISINSNEISKINDEIKNKLDGNKIFLKIKNNVKKD